VVDASTGQLSSCEALVRWNHPTHGLLTPVSFLAVIAAGGMSGDLARWMLGQVLNQLGSWTQANIAIPIAVNLSALDVADNQLMDWLLTEIGDREIPANLLSIELTEAELLDRSEQTIETLMRLRDAGVTTAVDDFGTGYSSLVWLRDLPIHTLKIDRSFVESMFADERSETIVRSTIQMAQALRLMIVGEGVEDERTAVALRELGCNDLQGYHFSRPVNAQEMTRILTAGEFQIDAFGVASIAT
jgi:diguanylate cyclase